MDVKNLNEVPDFTTKDGSEIRELLAHRNSAIRNQSLAEARVPSPAARRNTITPRRRRFITSPKAGAESASKGRCARSRPAMSSGFRPARSIGMVRRQPRR